MSNGQTGIKWRFLVVEDNEDMSRQLREMSQACVAPPDEVEVDNCPTFKKAIARLRTERYDLLILDLKDDSDTTLEGDSNPAGLSIFEELKKTRFVPVVFYTALAHKVRSEQTSFVRVVEKTEDVTRVKEEVQQIFATKLPTLNRHVEEIQRDYMWQFVSKHWKDFDSPLEQADIAYLLARRLALSLQAEGKRLARKMSVEGVPLDDSPHIHPMEMYVHPPVSNNRLAGDIVRGLIGEQSGDWLVLTPSCDFEQKGRIYNVLLAQCMPLTEQTEYLKWKQDSSDANAKSLKELIGDNRGSHQRERFKFLPGTFFISDSVVDFQRLKAVASEDFAKLEVVASLDSPFAEAVLTKFARYFGRLGTPDIDKDVILNRLQGALQEKGPALPATPPTAPAKQ